MAMAAKAAAVALRRATLLVVIFLVSAALSAAGASAAAAPGPGASSSPFVLAAEQTQRKDPLDGLRYYTGGWNISDEHYWASVGFTAAPVFAAAGVWFVVFGIGLFIAGCCFCCCPGSAGGDSYSRACLFVSLALLFVVTAAAAVGCAVLYDGQGRFHGSTAATVDYVVRQSGDTVATLRGFTGFLETARAAGVGPVTLPDDVKGRIDGVVRRVGAAADELAARTASNAAKIRAALETVRKVLIVVAAAMLILAFLGLVFSLCGLESIIYVLVFLGWILVAGTFLLCGTFLLLHNVVGDTCVAMGEWVERPPRARTALDDILPCVDTAAANEALDRGKEVNYQLVSLLNAALANVSNADFPPGIPPPLNYNQSGPPVPLLCNPYTPDLRGRACAPGELPLDPAAARQAWRRYVCQTTTAATAAAAGSSNSSLEVCATPGRVTPAMYEQLGGAADVSYGLYHYGPALVALADCTVVRETFRAIGGDHCPGLGRYSGQVFRGLLAAAVAVMLAVLLWVVHARERRRRSEAKEGTMMASSMYKFPPVEERAFLRSPARPYM